MAHVTQLMELGVGIAAWIYVVRCCCAFLRQVPDTWENIQWDFRRNILCKLGKHSRAQLDAGRKQLPQHICRYCYVELSSPLSVVDKPAD